MYNRDIKKEINREHESYNLNLKFLLEFNYAHRFEHHGAGNLYLC